MDNLAHENSKNNKPNGKKTPSWKLSDKERDERRKTAEGEAHELAAELEASQAELRRLRRTEGCPDV